MSNLSNPVGVAFATGPSLVMLSAAALVNRRTRRKVISEAIGYGLDVEPERCDVSLLTETVRELRGMSEPCRSAAVDRLNRGEGR